MGKEIKTNMLEMSVPFDTIELWNNKEILKQFGDLQSVLLENVESEIDFLIPYVELAEEYQATRPTWTWL